MREGEKTKGPPKKHHHAWGWGRKRNPGEFAPKTLKLEGEGKNFYGNQRTLDGGKVLGGRIKPKKKGDVNKDRREQPFKGGGTTLGWVWHKRERRGSLGSSQTKTSMG